MEKVCGVYDCGYVTFDDNREDCSNHTQHEIAQTGYDLVHFTITGTSANSGFTNTDFTFSLRDQKGHVICHFRARDRITHTILSVALQEAEKQAHLLRSPNLVFSAKIFEGLILMKPQYIALFKDRMFAQGHGSAVAKNPKKEATLCCSLDELEIRPYGNDGRGVFLERKQFWKKRTSIYLWFITPEERSHFFALTTFPHQLDSVAVLSNQCTGANMMKALNQECNHHLMKLPETESNKDAQDNRASQMHSESHQKFETGDYSSIEKIV
ncbi:uncharacterized protein LOC129585884 isoform X2 [Paramacrobiotus metropolitanus]|nr:uncharacterized protein LOC129585884 isoform X2 [Paramacrobiotus metropolitanus]